MGSGCWVLDMHRGFGIMSVGMLYAVWGTGIARVGLVLGLGHVVWGCVCTPVG